jgi:4-hydroxy-2-oxoheptanedioate aldolase
MTTNRLRALFAEGGSAVGGWCTTPSPFNAELLAVEGYDYVCVDCQHGLIGYDAMVPLLASLARTGTTPLVRVPFNHTPWMGRALDAGAEGVIVPMVNTREDAERAAAACRYAPEGVRSFGPVRAGLFLNQAPPAEVNRQVLCFVMIETVQGVENAEDICAAPGVDGVYVGPADLAISMGVAFGVDPLPAAHAEALDHVARVCAAQGIVPGIHTGGGADARRALEGGYRMATVSTDAALFRGAIRAELAAARGSADASAAGEGGIYG